MEECLTRNLNEAPIQPVGASIQASFFRPILYLIDILQGVRATTILQRTVEPEQGGIRAITASSNKYQRLTLYRSVSYLSQARTVCSRQKERAAVTRTPAPLVLRTLPNHSQ